MFDRAPGVKSLGISSIDAPSVFFPLFLALGCDGHVMKFICIQRSYCREEGIIGPVVRTVEKSQVQRAGWASDHGFSFKDVFILGYRGFAADGLLHTRSGVVLNRISKEASLWMLTLRMLWTFRH